MTQVVGMRELQGALRAQIEKAEGPAARKALMAGGLVVERRAKQNVREQHLIDTGLLRESITASAVTDLLVRIGTPLIYASIHEFGGDITPKNRQYLAIPLTNKSRKVGPRDYPEALRFVPVNDGGFLVDAAGDAQYALRKRVTIPARPYLRPAIDKDPHEIYDAIARALWAELGDV